jgi:hypothetical protein
MKNQKNELATLSPNQSNCYAADPRDCVVIEAGDSAAPKMATPFHGQCGSTDAEYERLLREGELCANASDFAEQGEQHPNVNRAGQGNPMPEFTAREQDLIRWCYFTAGYSRPLLAKHFQTTVDHIQEIVSGGLPREEVPATSAAGKRQPCKLEFQADSLLRPQAENPKVDREWLRKIFRRALTE